MPAAVVNLSGDQTSVQLSEEDRKLAVDAAHWVTASPHEWQWSPEQQAAMARYVLWAHQRLSAVEQVVSGELRHAMYREAGS